LNPFIAVRKPFEALTSMELQDHNYELANTKQRAKRPLFH
jgi:hypothetical protein